MIISILSVFMSTVSLFIYFIILFYILLPYLLATKEKIYI